MQRQFKTRRRTAFAIPVLLLIYLAYLFVSFDIPGLAARARMDNARILLSDFVAYKTHVTRDNRTDKITVSIEGEAKATYTPSQYPDLGEGQRRRHHYRPRPRQSSSPMTPKARATASPAMA